MGIESLRDLYFDELGDLYDAETQAVRLLPRLAEAARAPELRDALTKHCDESRLHLERLQLIFTHWGERIAPRPCAGVAGIVQEADERLNEPATADARDAAIIGVAQRVEHYEIAAYGCARTYARRLNRSDEARLLQETLEEEGRADRRLTEIAESHVNDDARTEADLLEMPRRGRLRFVTAKQLDFSRLPQKTLRVRNDNDEDLGTFDGIIVDEATRPQYIVVDSGGFFPGRRYLLPAGHVRFDESSGALRVSLAKEVAKQYPEFDRDEFESMSADRLRGYEARLLEFFPRATGAAPRQPSTAIPVEELDWLLTGVWVTVPPERAERLSDEARTFANEFAPNRGQVDRERLVAHTSEPPPPPVSEHESATPPHGDKLR